MGKKEREKKAKKKEYIHGLDDEGCTCAGCGDKLKPMEEMKYDELLLYKYGDLLEAAVTQPIEVGVMETICAAQLVLVLGYQNRIPMMLFKKVITLAVDKLKWFWLKQVWMERANLERFFVFWSMPNNMWLAKICSN